MKNLQHIIDLWHVEVTVNVLDQHWKPRWSWKY
jgi:hypothetical protein